MPNRLRDQTSPYLQQHAHNPVQWHPWDAEALALARRDDKPILLSVGYSACHWCHVMAHECFEDEDTAALMNRHFVNVKVDREERPDIDQIYQSAHQLMSRRGGGWPLTMFLTPDAKPFFGGTYFPKRARHGLPGFDELLERIAELWRTRRAQIESHGGEVVRVLESIAPEPGAEPLDTLAADAGTRLRDTLMASFDRADGGFGGAPKFPHPTSLETLLRHAVARHDDAARDAALLTLRRMAEGGLYDHLGGGFFRYSTDAKWLIPHFEKMLYDNGLLLKLYAQAWQLTREPLFARVCDETAGWLMREMQGPAGGYCSSIDADSSGDGGLPPDSAHASGGTGEKAHEGAHAQGGEGRFYLWQRDEVAAALEPDAFAAFAARYGLDGPPNFERRAWHLHVARPLDALAAQLGAAPAEVEARIDAARAALFARREARVRPARDDKVLASWNALAIEGLAFAARVFGRADWAASAWRAFAFVQAELWRDGRLLATHKDGVSHLNAYLDDHAFLLGAALELLQHGALDVAQLRFACRIADTMLERFEDAAEGGFHFTSHDHEALVTRPKTGHDGATPSGNGVAALQLQRLGHLLGESRYRDAARRTLAAFAGDVERSPHACATLVAALGELHAPPTVIVLTGAPEPLDAWRAALVRAYRPALLVVHPGAEPAGLPAALAKPASAKPQGWVCRGTECLAPADSLDAIEAAL